MYLILLDASKAFDRVKYCKLFDILLNRNMCSSYLRLIINMYTTQKLRVKWGDVCSSDFKCINGVKQGGVLSPILFCVYMDELLSRLSGCGLGCYVGKTFMGAMCYADDLTIISPSRRSMEIMLQICEDFATEYHVKFNSTKSILITYNVKHDVSFTLDNDIISKLEHTVHLGHHVGVNSNTNNINKANRELICRTNTMLSRFNFCSSEIKSRLFRTYCTSFYGCPLWDLSSDYIKYFYRTWRKCIRRVWNLPYRCHNKFTYIIYDNLPIDIQLMLRFINFYLGVLTSKNPIVSICSQLCSHSNTAVAKNKRKLLHYLNDNGDILLEKSYKILDKLRHMNEYCESDLTTCMFILELRNIIGDQYTLRDFEIDEVKYLLHNICTQ